MPTKTSLPLHIPTPPAVFTFDDKHVVPDPNPSDIGMTCAQVVVAARDALIHAIVAYFTAHGVIHDVPVSLGGVVIPTDGVANALAGGVADTMVYNCSVVNFMTTAQAEIDAAVRDGTNKVDAATHQIVSLQAQHVSDQHQIDTLNQQLHDVATPQQTLDTIASLRRQLDDAVKAAALAASNHTGTVVAGVLGILGGVAIGRRQH